MRSRSFMGQLGCLMGLGLLLGACQGVVNVGGGNGGGGNGGGGGPGPLPKADKIDLLLVVDNSRSMADKQQLLALGLPELVKSLANPPCIDENGVISGAPPSWQDACPMGQTRRHAPVMDIHIGVISTSLGGHGSDSCPDVEDPSTVCSPNTNLTNNDKGHLLTRIDQCGGAWAPTYQDMGFLAWDPAQRLAPPGEVILDDGSGGGIVPALRDMVLGVGQIGCGYESQLESWYRFLADPDPYNSISVGNDFKIALSGTDNALLEQRASFLRPDSMLVILSLTDENDCSLNEVGQNWATQQLRNPDGTPFRMPRARSECATNPNDPCCASCGQKTPPGCPEDPECIGPNGTFAQLDAADDDPNLRCFDQKRRFGIDFLHPVTRYINALTQPMIPNRAGDLVQNPIFSDLDPSDGTQAVRDPGLVFMASISGVPWQAIARNPQDLSAGYMNATELEQSGTWDEILGDPSAHVPPTNPYMIESITPRMWIMPGNDINGGERTISSNDDLQYSCTFPLFTPNDCSSPNQVSCDCIDPNNDNPNCNGTLQIGAKAYPSPRTMSVIKGIGDQGVLTSICPAELTDQPAPDFAYRPVIAALLERMATRL